MNSEYPSTMRFNMGGLSPEPEAQHDARKEAIKAEVGRLLDALAPEPQRHVAILACEHEMHVAELVRDQMRDAGMGTRIVLIGAGHVGQLPFSSGPMVELLKERTFVPWVVDTPKNEPWYRRHATRGKGRKY